ncbi:MAG TPA: phosphoenolpyruvate--protein phosphotransferase [Gemmatimonadota bacterium]|nr:phosphoenolpyruvate--protein phosphotransferase [Gemmatimonadota bacterium]
MSDETILRGLGVSFGVAYGPAYLIAPDALRVPRRAIDEKAVEDEIARFETALVKTRTDIERVRRALIAAQNPDEASIFDSHRLILEDAELLESTRDLIRRERVNAEHAFDARVMDCIQRLGRSQNAYLRERIRDIRDVEHRVIRNLLGEREPAAGDLMQNAVLVAHDLPAALTAELDRDRILGFATEVGAANSHTAILARALEIPAVIDLGPILSRIPHGVPVILDGREGLLIVRPSEATIAKYERVRAKIERKRAEWVSLADVPGATADGHPLTFLANIEFPREVDAALAFGCEGVGLYRTEYLFLQSGGEASEDEQYAIYRDVVERMAGRPVTIRTIDLGGDKLLTGMEAEENPFLGWRAIRYCLDRPEIFRAQLRAILRAGAHGPVSVMLPMITNLEEVDEALEHMAAARAALDAEGVPHAASCPIGVLVETPAAALLADDLVERFDFLSLGTNDLIQYTLAVDRGNRRIAHLFQPFHPAILRMIRDVAGAAERAGVELTLCGEMGSNTRAAALLVGLGLRRFSMVAARIPRVKQVLGRIGLEEARQAAQEALGARTAKAARRIIDERFADRFWHAAPKNGGRDEPGAG